MHIYPLHQARCEYREKQIDKYIVYLQWVFIPLSSHINVIKINQNFPQMSKIDNFVGVCVPLSLFWRPLPSLQRDSTKKQQQQQHCIHSEWR